MTSIQRAIQNIVAQMKALSPSARLLIGSLMIILVMALFLVSLYTGKPAMSPLGLAANLGTDARGRVESYLNQRGIAFEPKGSDIMVPLEQKYAVLGALADSQVIGGDQINFDTLISDDSPFRTQAQNRQRYLMAKMSVLGTMIAQMDGIERAKVVIDVPESGAGIGRAYIPPSASVSVITRVGELSQGQVDAIARLVAGSHAGLKPQNVTIIDARNGRSLSSRSDELMSAGKYMEVKLEAERHARESIEQALAYIDGVRVAVNAQVDTKEVVQSTSKYDDPKLGILSEKNTNISSTNQTGGSEPAVKPNTSVAINSGSTRGSQLTDERSETSSVPFAGKTEAQIRDAKGYALQINATIGVPKSYFLKVYQDNKGANAAGQPPDQAALDAIIQTETDRIKAAVMPLIDTQGNEGSKPGIVWVGMTPDFGAASLINSTDGGVAGASGGGGSGGGGGFSGGGSGLSDNLVKYVSLGGLAALSLTMMFMMVRKAGVRPELPSASELVGIPPALQAAESDLVGEADEAAPALEGLELDDSEIRRSQMLEQITDMIKSTPDEAAMLMRRWMRSDAA